MRSPASSAATHRSAALPPSAAYVAFLSVTSIKGSHFERWLERCSHAPAKLLPASRKPPLKRMDGPTNVHLLPATLACMTPMLPYGEGMHSVTAACSVIADDFDASGNAVRHTRTHRGTRKNLPGSHTYSPLPGT